MAEYIDIVFDGEHFVEIEDEHGRSRRVGMWIPEVSGLRVLRIQHDEIEKL